MTSPRAMYGSSRMSAQRACIAQAVQAARGAFTADEIHRSIGAGGERIGLATVYRALAAMQAAGTVTQVGERDGSALLASCDRHDHHHHLVCTSCHGVFGIECPLGSAALESAGRAGHLVTSHEITLYGLCSRCRTGTG